jgi:putative SOS response-associated peptidase YedK
MCGRYTQGKAIPELVSRYAQLGAQSIAAQQVLHPAFNIAPSSFAAVLRMEHGHPSIDAARWGLVPSWTRSLDALKSKPFNARSETADSGPMFRDAFQRGRCIVPATGFFEWQGAKSPKQPWYIHTKDQEIASFAGLWSRWVDPGSGTAMDTFAILTTDANDVVKPIHDRMPCILRPGEEAAWLDLESKIAFCKMLLRPYPADLTLAHRVGPAVGKPGTDGEQLIAPVESAADGEESWLF